MSSIPRFSHFTFVQSNGRCVVCGFRGAQNKNSNEFKLTNPIIHSKDRVYGKRDKGAAGIDEVIERHVCNDICRSWMSDEQDIINMTTPVLPLCIPVTNGEAMCIYNDFGMHGNVSDLVNAVVSPHYDTKCNEDLDRGKRENRWIQLPSRDFVLQFDNLKVYPLEAPPSYSPPLLPSCPPPTLYSFLEND